MSGSLDTESLLPEILSKVSEALENNRTVHKATVGRFGILTEHFITISAKYPLLPSILFLGVAVALIVVGSFASIDSIPTTALPPTREHKLFDPTDNDLDHECAICFEGEDYVKDGEITLQQAITMPLFGSISLLSLYFLVKYTGLEWMQIVTKILRAMTFLMSIPANLLSFRYMIDCVLRQLPLNPLRWNTRYRISFVDDNRHISQQGIVENFNYINSITGEKSIMPDIKNKKDSMLFKRELRQPTVIKSQDQILNFYYNEASFVAFLLSVLISILNLIYGQNNWLLDNLNASNLAIYSISTLAFTNLKSASVTLTLFFFYDIFFVFVNDVMVTVATTVDIPAKLLIPTSFADSTSTVHFSLLGLGDIIIPGLLVSLCYRFDIWKWHQVHTDQEFHLKRWSYFGFYTGTSLISYIIGLSICTLVLHYYRLPQPALLYLVPSMLLSVFILATARSELQELWDFNYSTIISPPLDTEHVLSLSDFESEFENEDTLETDNDPLYTSLEASIDISETESEIETETEAFC